jgi:hypothetical protein
VSLTQALSIQLLWRSRRVLSGSTDLRKTPLNAGSFIPRDAVGRLYRCVTSYPFAFHWINPDSPLIQLLQGYLL